MENEICILLIPEVKFTTPVNEEAKIRRSSVPRLMSIRLAREESFSLEADWCKQQSVAVQGQSYKVAISSPREFRQVV